MISLRAHNLWKRLWLMLGLNHSGAYSIEPKWILWHALLFWGTSQLFFILLKSDWNKVSISINVTFLVIPDDVINWKHFPRYSPFVRGIHWIPVKSPHTGQERGALIFSLICAWTNGWANNRDAGDLRRHRAHFYVTVMYQLYICSGTDKYVIGFGDKYDARWFCTHPVKLFYRTELRRDDKGSK